MRGAFLGLGVFFPLCAWFLDQWHSYYFFIPVISTLLGERLLYEIQFTLSKATHLMKQIQKSDDSGNDYGNNLINLRNKISETLSSYDPEKRVATLLKKNTGLEDVLGQEFILKGKYNSGQYAIGEVWNKPEYIEDEGPAHKPDMKYRTKLRLWKSSVDIATKELEMIEKGLSDRNEKALAGIVKFQIIMLKDGVLQNKVKRGLASSESFSYGLKKVLDPMIEKLKNPNPKFDRSADLKDLEQRLLRASNRRSFLQPDHSLDLSGKIILCQSILPTEILQYTKQGANGFIVLNGEKASHSSILFNSMNIESVTGIDVEELDLANGTLCIIDAKKKFIVFRPTNEKYELYSDLLNNQPEDEAVDSTDIFFNKERFYVRANISIVNEIASIKKTQPNGIGLFRSELQFMLYDIMPNVEKQVEIYKEITEAFPNEQVTLRILDSGGDKASNYNVHIKEENPSLGFKGIRYLLSEPQILRNQIEAMTIAMLNKNGTILIPMISTMDEVIRVHEIYKSTLEKFGPYEEIKKNVKLGLMIETPASILMLDEMQVYFDSFSIGTNDLTQYILAADRNNSYVSSVYSNLSPAILRSISKVSESCQRFNKPMSICGELAQNIEALPLLIGLGIRDISINHNEIAQIRTFARSLDIDACRELARKVLECSSEKEVSQLLIPFKEKLCPQK